MRNVHKQIASEISQSSDTRRQLFDDIQLSLGNRTLVTYFTSFRYPVDINDDDVNMLQSVLQNVNLTNGLVLMISSPGGDGIAAERIVNVCRAYSGTDDYWALIPGKAKSAATVICMGASKILMGPSSELGPVDPQIIIIEDDKRQIYSAHSLVSGYDKLFEDIAKTKGPIEPYIQQLHHYDNRDITHYRSLIELSKDISKKVLKKGMMSTLKLDEIENKIEVFLNPAAGTLTHGRPIYADEAKSCDLLIEELNIHSDNWKKIYELYTRTEQFVSFQACKAVESAEESFHAPIN